MLTLSFEAYIIVVFKSYVQNNYKNHEEYSKKIIVISFPKHNKNCVKLKIALIVHGVFLNNSIMKNTMPSFFQNENRKIFMVFIVILNMIKM